VSTIYAEFKKNVRRHPKRKAILFFEEEAVVAWTYQKLHDKTVALAAALLDIGLKKGDRIALLAQNGPEWNLIELAVAKNGMVLVPIHTTLSIAQIRQILRKSKADALVFGSAGSLPSLSLYDLMPNFDSIMLKLARELSPRMKHLILMDPGMAHHVGSRVHHLPKLVAQGKELIAKKKAPASPRVGAQDVSTLIYTSGTTGDMKGVILTHRNIVSNAQPAGKITGASSRDLFVIPLPLSHAFGRITALSCLCYVGCSIFYERRLTRLVQGLQELKPTVMCAVPRLLEKMYEAIQEKINGRSAVTTRIFQSALASSSRYHRLQDEKSVFAPFFHMQDSLANRLLYRKIREVLGGRLKYIISGGSPLDPEVARFFQNIGITILEGYGLTETSPIATLNPYWRPRIGSVGLPIPGVSIKIGEHKEVLIKGPNVMVGYEGHEKATQCAIDEKGWLHTGDQGSIDKDGYLYIIGRIKEMIVTSYGKNISPVGVERELEHSPFLKQVMIYGDNRPYLMALVVPDQAALNKWFKRSHINGLSWPQLCKHKETSKLIRNEIRKQSASLSTSETVKKFRVISEDFSQENGLLTPTLKLKRPAIVEKYRQAIDSTY